MNFFILQKFFCILDQLGLNFYAINLMIFTDCNIVVYNQLNFQIDTPVAYKLRSARIFFILQKIFRILDQLGLNLEAINLKFLQIVGYIVVYNL